MARLARPLLVCMFEPIIASKPRKHRNQNANGNEEAERDHPYP